MPKPVRMTLADGRTRAFANLREAVEWMTEQEMPANTAKVSVSMPPELKEFLRDSGRMSTQLRALAMKATGAHWKATERKRQTGNVTRLRPGRPKKVRYA